MTRSSMRARSALATMLVAFVLAGCGGGRSYDNPPEVPVGTVGNTTVPSTTTTTAPTTSAFIPSTAPTTVPPPTNPPPPATYAPTVPPPTNAPPPPTQPVNTTGEQYTVVGGDTLFGISSKLGVPFNDLLAANGLNASTLIIPGQQLNVPVGGSVPATGAPATNPPATNPPATNPPATNPPATNPPATNPPATNPPSATTTFPPPEGGVVPQETSASCQAPDSAEADGTPIVFSPGNVFDYNPATAWRCDAGSAQTLTLTFDGPVHLTSVGLIGGYVKVDPLTGVDRFTQNHRVRQVRWTFDGGTTVVQDLSDSPDMQTTGVDVTASTVTLEILSTYPPGGEAPRDMVPVAEVQFISG